MSQQILNKSFDLTIIIVNWNTRDMLLNCLRSIIATDTDIAVQIIVVDNSSHDGSRDMVRTLFPNVELINSGANLGFGRANNIAIPFAKAPVLLFLNPDTIVLNNSLKTMLSFLMKNPSVGAVSCKTLDVEGKPHHLGLQWFPTPITQFIKYIFLSNKTIDKMRRVLPYKNPNQSSYVSKLYGACIMIKKSVLDQVGYFDERFFMYCEDVDISRRIIAAGWSLYYMSEAEIIHFVGGSSSLSTNNFTFLMMSESMSKLIEKYHGKIGKIGYRIVVFLGSMFRLMVLLIIYFYKRVLMNMQSKNISYKVKKYITLLKWSLRLQQPEI